MTSFQACYGYPAKAGPVGYDNVESNTLATQNVPCRPAKRTDTIMLVRRISYQTEISGEHRILGFIPKQRDNMATPKITFIRPEFAAGLVLLLLVSLGCQPQPASEEPQASNSRPTASNVALRILVASEMDDPEVVKRKWLASSAQPIELEVVSPSELLAMDKARCDVLLFPSRLMGELVHRKWIVKLPSSMLSETQSLDDTSLNTPRAWMAQCIYDAKQFALPLGCEVPVLVASDSVTPALADNAGLSWKELLSHVTRRTALEVDEPSIDKQALVDRFLAIVGTTSPRSSKYGKLFELRTMKPLLSNEEFVQAAEILADIASQSADGSFVLGSHASVWQAVAQASEPRVSIASLSRLTPDVALISQGQVSALLPNPAPESSDEDSPQKATCWNTGGALIAALADDCSQTAQSMLFLDWLAKSETRSFLQPKLAGVDATSPTTGLDALSWKAAQALRRSLTSDVLPQEVRLPAASEYRTALADELIEFLRGNKTSSQALEDAAAQWSIITAENPMQQLEYEKSLGLTF